MNVAPPPFPPPSTSPDGGSLAPPAAGQDSATQEQLKAFLPPEPPETAPWGRKMRYWAWKYMGTLVMEQTPAGEYVMSLGKASAAALLAQAMWRWGASGTDLPESMKQTLWILLAYNIGTRGVNIAQTYVHGALNMGDSVTSPPTAPKAPTKGPLM